MSEIVLSIVVVTYNAAEFLPATMNSLRLQEVDERNPRHEVLLIDGGSRDGTLEMARDANVFTSIISEPDRGIYDAMNKGAKLARGDWVQFLNAGDAFTGPNSLAALLIGLERASSSTWAVCGAQNMSYTPPRRIPSIPHVWVRHALGLQPHCHQASFFRRSVFLSMGGHSMDFGITGDFDLIMRFGLQTPPHVIETVHLDYLGGGISDGAWRTSSANQHAIRVTRLQLGGILSIVDNSWTTLSRTYGQFRVLTGRQRKKLMRWRSR